MHLRRFNHKLCVFDEIVEMLSKKALQLLYFNLIQMVNVMCSYNIII